MTAPGVGPVVAITFKTAVDDPKRISKSKAVGALFGLTPNKYQSGETDVTGGITRVGDAMVRTALYEAANTLLSRVTRFSALKRWGMPMGPFAMGDLAGLDIGWRSRKDRGIKSEIADALCEAGRFGQKTGKGYYKYEGGSRAPLPDPEVEKLIDETLQRLGRKRRVVSDDEILERMMYPMINEGARILEEKVAARPSDIDVIWLYGYGWPIYRGGPMFYADQVGLKHIADRLSFYARETNDPSLEPAPLLKRLAAEGKTFASLAQSAKAA